MCNEDLNLCKTDLKWQTLPQAWLPNIKGPEFMDSFVVQTKKNAESIL